MKILQKSKLAFAALVIAAGVASPACAQSFSRGWGTGNVLPFSYGPVVPDQHKHVARYSRSYEAYASVPRSHWGHSIGSDPVAGGSIGYNQLLMTH